jgi:hypothetical protein
LAEVLQVQQAPALGVEQEGAKVYRRGRHSGTIYLR